MTPEEPIPKGSVVIGRTHININFEYSSTEELTEKLKKLKSIEVSQLPNPESEIKATLILSL